jgi:hypothetical protein
MTTWRDFLKKNGRLLLITSVSAVGILWWTGRSKPERLGTVPPYRLMGSMDYRASVNSDRTLSILARVVWEKKEREIARIPLVDDEVGLSALPPSLHRKGDSLYFLLDQGKRTQEKRPQKKAKLDFRGADATPQKPVILQYTRYPVPNRLRLCRLSCQGGPVQEVLRDLNTDRFTVVGEDIYWIRGKPEAVTSIWERSHPSHYRETVLPRSDLMHTSLRTGMSRQIATGFPLHASLFAGRDAVYWIKQSHPGDPKTKSELWRYQPALPAPERVLADYKNIAAPLEADARLYWIEREGGNGTLSGEISNPDQVRLLSTNPDGSDKRPVLDLVTNKTRRWDQYRFYVYNDRLYALLKEPPRSATSPTSNAPETLYRVRPHATHPLHPLFKMPRNSMTDRTHEMVFFEKGFFYFTCREEHEDWLHATAPSTVENTLYRIRLAEE